MNKQEAIKIIENLYLDNAFTLKVKEIISQIDEPTVEEPTVEEPTVKDMVNHPSHYQGKNGLEVIDVIKAFAPTPEHLEGWYWGNTVKYVLRCYNKNGVEDLRKDRNYLDELIEALEEKE